MGPERGSKKGIFGLWKWDFPVFLILGPVEGGEGCKNTRNTKEYPWSENTKENQNTKEWKIRETYCRRKNDQSLPWDSFRANFNLKWLF